MLCVYTHCKKIYICHNIHVWLKLHIDYGSPQKEKEEKSLLRKRAEELTQNMNEPIRKPIFFQRLNNKIPIQNITIQN